MNHLFNNMSFYAFDDMIPHITTFSDDISAQCNPDHIYPSNDSRCPCGWVTEMKTKGDKLFQSELPIYEHHGRFEMRGLDYVTSVTVPTDTSLTIYSNNRSPIFTCKLKAHRHFKMFIPTLIFRLHIPVQLTFDPPVDHLMQYGGQMSTQSRHDLNLIVRDQGVIYLRSLNVSCSHFDTLHGMTPQFSRYEKIRRCYLLVRLQRAIKAWLYSKIMRLVHEDIKYMPGGNLYMEAKQRWSSYID